MFNRRRMWLIRSIRRSYRADKLPDNFARVLSNGLALLVCFLTQQHPRPSVASYEFSAFSINRRRITLTLRER
jgi:hypothetical protein